MTERPILFSAPMVRALLDGSKTQTRRVVKMPRSWDCIVYADWGNGFWPYASDDGESPSYDNIEVPMVCPYGQPGDRLWVRETWYCDHFDVQKGPYLEVDDASALLAYAADGLKPYEEQNPWRPSIHMPRWASRILLEITSVRVERLSDISEADSRAEGATGGHGVCPSYNYNATPSEHFSHIWESISGAGSWAANPWVWVVEFKRVSP